MYSQIIVLFPSIPFIAAIIILLFKYGFRMDISTLLIKSTLGVMIAAGLFLVYCNKKYGDLLVPLSYLDYSINFIFDGVRVYFMITFLVPCFFVLFGMKGIESLNMRVVFLFFLAGCSGIVLTGDFFNFFVFYELMIMGAYVLITINKDYFAGIRYMFIGAVSSTILLAGIILWFAMGNYFNLTDFSSLAGVETSHAVVLLGLFIVAFIIKGGLFPACNWTAVCHAATVSTVSSFLSSFTIFSGVFGIYHFVIIPAQLLKLDSVLVFLRAVSIFSILYSSFYVFYESHFKKMIAGTTVTATSIVVLLLTNGNFKAAFTYMIIHAVYKTSLFLLYEKSITTDEIENKNTLFTDPITYILMIVFFLFTAGFFPTATYMLKSDMTGLSSTYRVLFYLSAFFIMSGLLKYKVSFKFNKPALIHFICPVVLVFFYICFWIEFKVKPVNIIDPVLLIISFTLSHLLFKFTPLIHSFEKRFIFKNFNYELFYIILLFTGVFMFFAMWHAYF